jgi:hypothetical protein
MPGDAAPHIRNDADPGATTQFFRKNVVIDGRNARAIRRRRRARTATLLIVIG